MSAERLLSALSQDAKSSGFQSSISAIRDKKSRNAQSIDFAKAVDFMKQVIPRYLADETPGPGDRYGFMHGPLGKRRARKLEKYLNAIPADTDHNIELLSLFLAVFGEPTYFPRIRRSSKLASMIADQWITGDRTNTMSLESNSQIVRDLSSKVFSGQLFDKVLSNSENDDVYEIISFNATKGVRDFLQRFINHLMPTEKAATQTLAENFRRILENSSEEISLEIIPVIANLRPPMFIAASFSSSSASHFKKPPESRSLAGIPKQPEAAETGEQHIGKKLG